MLLEDKPIAPPESQGMPPGKENPGLTDEVYIPDYVMLDFGVPLQLKPAGGHPSNSVS